MQYDIAQAKLRKHLNWAIHNDDEFISWTSSLLWALQFAVRKTKFSAEHELRVCVLDTSRFITGTFLSASHLIQTFGLAAFSDCTVEYHTTTYLAHGSLNVQNCSRTVSLACLRENGLFDLLPELEDEYWKPRLFLRVRNLRQTLVVSAVNSLSEGTCQGALRVASSFGGEWAMPMTMAFLALRGTGTSQNHEVLLQLIRDFAGKMSRNANLPRTLTHHTAEPERNLLDPLPPYEGLYGDAPELAHFAEMMNWGFAEMQKIRLQESDGLAQLDAGINDLGLRSANATNDTQDTMPADDPSVSAPQPTAGRPSRKAKTTVVSLTLAGASVITARVVERNMRHPDLPTGLIVDVENGSRPDEDPISSTRITLGSGHAGKNVTVSVKFSGDASDGDGETEGLSNEQSLEGIV